jgi:DNA polymerase elongation subunit (family B)
MDLSSYPPAPTNLYNFAPISYDQISSINELVVTASQKEEEELIQILDWMRNLEDDYTDISYNDWCGEEEENSELVAEEVGILEGTPQERREKMEEIMSQRECKEIIESIDMEDEEKLDDDSDLQISQLDGTSDDRPKKKRKKTIEVHAGDFVALRAPNNSPPYIGYILSVDHTANKISVRWLYRAEDTHTGKAKWSDRELFVTPYIDQNPIASIEKKVKVSPKGESGDFFCRYEYSVEKREFTSLSEQVLQLFNWKTKPKEEKQVPENNRFVIEKIIDFPMSQQSEVSSIGDGLSQTLLMDVENETTYYNPSIPSTAPSSRSLLSNEGSPIASFRTPISTEVSSNEIEEPIENGDVMHSFDSIDSTQKQVLLKYKTPPTRAELVIKKEYTNPYYSKVSDFESGYRTAVNRFQTTDAFDLTRKRVLPLTKELYHLEGATKNMKTKLANLLPPMLETNPSETKIKLRYAPRPPTIQILMKDVSSLPKTPERKRSQFISQISMPTPQKKAHVGFKKPKNITSTMNTPSTATVRLPGLSALCIELHINTREGLKPDPAIDAVVSVYYELSNDTMKQETLYGCFTVGEGKIGDKLYFSDETKLLKAVVDFVREKDPDVLLGYEIQMGSWGYLIERSAVLGFSMVDSLSRYVTTKKSKRPIDEWGRTHQSGVFVKGRIVLNLWRIMRHEVKTNSYRFQNVVFHVLGIRFPEFPYHVLTKLYTQLKPHEKAFVDEYHTKKVSLTMQMLAHLDILNRTGELARVFGCDFFSVVSRGSQYRVESMMVRLTRPRNYVLLAPSREQVMGQAAIECLPLVMEPESRLYTSPVLVLDFQSLYPSIVIAYNLCYSTCLGKLVTGVKQFGVMSQFKADLEERDDMMITPNGVMFVKDSIRSGVLPRMLREILNTRVMIKTAMKKLDANDEQDQITKKILNARQFGLKMIANVTYGYTSANFSGRMPCSEIADSIVQLGRRTLERAIDTVEKEFGDKCRVVYGDTDSMFVECPGASREEAFRIGKAIAARVTGTNPNPVTLQMEKVFHPCFLITKKRYVGYAYESPNANPKFDAKGIETVRRDSCPVVQKMMEKVIRLVFENRDLSIVKSYCTKQWQKILEERVNIKDFIFAKEVKLGKYKREDMLPPAAIVAKSNMSKDRRTEPLFGDRVPYIVVYHQQSAGPNARLIDMVLDPHVYLQQQSKGSRPVLHGRYYIEKQILPCLDRFLCLIGVDVKQWFNDMPRRVRPGWRKARTSLKTLDGFYSSRYCAVCETRLVGGNMKENILVCKRCLNDEIQTVMWVNSRQRDVEKHVNALEEVCMSCGCSQRHVTIMNSCASIDCSVMFQKQRLAEHEKGVAALVEGVAKLFPPEDLF